MAADDYADVAQPDKVVASIRRAFAEPPPEHHRDHGPLVSIREVEYEGRTIRIRTEYAIEVDGKPIHGHLAVTDDGHIHYHAVPNYSFPSAVDLVKRLIDEYPADFPTKKKRKQRKTSDHHGDQGGHHH